MSGKVENGWFAEKEVLWPGQAMTLKVNKVLFEGKSDFQDLLVFESANYGNVLVLDGVIQLTTRDEFAYQEMITHLPLFSHPCPRSVLIVGGGDGGVLREVCRHSCVEQITMCEIDPMVVHVAKQYFKDVTATSFNDRRLQLLHMDAAKFVRGKADAFDVIIVDSSDPVGPAETLFEQSFYEGLKHSLKPGGIVCTQGECIWLHLDIIDKSLDACHRCFDEVDYAYTTIPTYPSGQIGFFLCGLTGTAPVRSIPPELQQQLRYYNSQIHSAAFVLPQFAEKVIAPLRKRRQPKSVPPSLGRIAMFAALSCVVLMRFAAKKT